MASMFEAKNAECRGTEDRFLMHQWVIATTRLNILEG
jgi:hypothetical protein